MDLDDPDVWRWIWLVGAAVFALGEMAIPTSFFLASFAVGATAAAATAFLGTILLVQWLVFLGVSAGSLLVLRPLSRRLDRETAEVANIGANRWVGKQAVVVRAIPARPGETGLVRIEREEWRAESREARAIPEQALVRVIGVEGTRLIVEPVPEEPEPSEPSDRPTSP